MPACSIASKARHLAAPSLLVLPNRFAAPHRNRFAAPHRNRFAAPHPLRNPFAVPHPRRFAAPHRNRFAAKRRKSIAACSRSCVLAVRPVAATDPIARRKKSRRVRAHARPVFSCAFASAGGIGTFVTSPPSWVGDASRRRRLPMSDATRRFCCSRPADSTRLVDRSELAKRPILPAIDVSSGFRDHRLVIGPDSSAHEFSLITLYPRRNQNDEPS